MEPPNLRVDVAMEFIDGYSWIEHACVKLIPTRFDHGIFRTDTYTTSSSINPIRGVGRNLANFSSDSLVQRDTPQPGRFLCICTKATSVNSATRITHLTRNLFQHSLFHDSSLWFIAITNPPLSQDEGSISLQTIDQLWTVGLTAKLRDKT